MIASESQMDVPQSFTSLYAVVGRLPQRIDLKALLERYELCEDMANLLTESALDKFHSLHITEQDVLSRVMAGLRDPGLGLSNDEALWVTTRLAELLNWPMLAHPKVAQ